MKIESITWKANVPNKGINAADAYNALEAIRTANNGLTDDGIVEAASAQDHVLHNWFEWDDGVAAMEHRRNQARGLLRAISVTYEEAPELKVRAYQVETKARTQDLQRTVYSTTAEVLANPEARTRLLAQAIRAALEFRNRFRQLHELDAVMQSIDDCLVRLTSE